MLTFQIDLPKGFAEQARSEFQRQVADDLRKAGIHGVTFKLSNSGLATFSGSEEALKKLEPLMRRWQK